MNSWTCMKNYGIFMNYFMNFKECSWAKFMNRFMNQYVRERSWTEFVPINVHKRVMQFHELFMNFKECSWAKFMNRSWVFIKYVLWIFMNFYESICTWMFMNQFVPFKVHERFMNFHELFYELWGILMNFHVCSWTVHDHFKGILPRNYHHTIYAK